MGEEEGVSEQSFFKGQWEGFKDFCKERFSFVDNYLRFRGKDIPDWSSSDLQQFIASDPIHGPTLKTAREAASFGVAGSVLGAASATAVAWKYSRSPHGAALTLVAGAAMGYTFGQEVANHWFQLYRMDTRAAEVKFLEWWERKSKRQF